MVKESKGKSDTHCYLNIGDNLARDEVVESDGFQSINFVEWRVSD